MILDTVCTTTAPVKNHSLQERKLVTTPLRNPPQEPLITRLLSIILIPQQRRPFTSKHARNPRVPIRHAPKRHAHAPLLRQTRPRDPLVGSGLHGQLLRRSGRVHPDVDLGVRHVHLLRGEELQRLDQGGLVWGRDGSGGRHFGGEVALQADAVDLDAVGFDEADDTGGAFGFGTGVLEGG